MLDTTGVVVKPLAQGSMKWLLKAWPMKNAAKHRPFRTRTPPPPFASAFWKGPQNCAASRRGAQQQQSWPETCVLTVALPELCGGESGAMTLSCHAAVIVIAGLLLVSAPQAAAFVGNASPAAEAMFAGSSCFRTSCSPALEACGNDRGFRASFAAAGERQCKARLAATPEDVDASNEAGSSRCAWVLVHLLSFDFDCFSAA